MSSRPKKRRLSKEETVHAKALKYLEHIAELVGALISAPIWMGDARYDASGYQFLVSSNSVIRLDTRTGEKQSTCVRFGKFMPAEEMVATILLFLHDDPKHFEKWRMEAKQDFQRAV